ncbi:MAG: hypothetical protein EOS71_00490 [Mesorhizobium sp.]|nr:hypothetical protein EOA35_00710 [Mesorhizobium sp. M8A.F.Ca.ET.023.01.1.1]RWC77758.1 MAG: hypothetical protein EOS71_00490 [Mesorhizobium sp.]
MKKIAAIAFVLFATTSPTLACHNYGCPDCGCVGAIAEKKAPELIAAINKALADAGMTDSQISAFSLKSGDKLSAPATVKCETKGAETSCTVGK